jgi:hypothetical protein
MLQRKNHAAVSLLVPQNCPVPAKNHGPVALFHQTMG